MCVWLELPYRLIESAEVIPLSITYTLASRVQAEIVDEGSRPAVRDAHHCAR